MFFPKTTQILPSSERPPAQSLTLTLFFRKRIRPTKTGKLKQPRTKWKAKQKNCVLSAPTKNVAWPTL